MEEITKSVIMFENYEVNYVKFVLNKEYQGEDVDVETKIQTNMRSDDLGNMEVELKVEVFPEAVKKNYPFEMKLSITGYFKSNIKKDIEKYQKNAVAILYPYARAIVSTYTASANVTPLILPTVNTGQFIKK